MLYFKNIIEIHKKLKVKQIIHMVILTILVNLNLTVLDLLHAHIGHNWIFENTWMYLIVEKSTHNWKVCAVTQHFLYPFVGKKTLTNEIDVHLFICVSTWHLREYKLQTSRNHHTTPVTCNVYTWKTASGEKVLSRCHSFNCDCITARQIAMGIRKHKHSLSAGC